MTLIAKKLKLLGKTQTEIANEVGVSQAYIASVIKGKILKTEAIKKFADVYGWDVYEIMRDFENTSNEDFISHLPEPEKKINPTVKDAMKKANQVIKGKKVFTEPPSNVVNDDDLVNATEIIVPFPGQAGLSSRMYPEELLQEFEKRTIRVKPQFRGVFYTIEVDGNSMPPKIQPKDWLRCEEISSLFWFEKDFFKEKNIYCIWHNTKGILFKRIIYKDGEMWCRSDNEDKKEYGDFPLEIEKVSKILIVRKLVDRTL